MATYTQAGRPLRVISSLADDQLMLVGFRGEEGMSMIGGFSLELCSPTATLAAKDFLMQPMGVVIEASDGSKRYLNGIVRRFGMTGQNDDLTLYRAEIVPWLWYLSVVQDCKIFQNLSVPDIIEKVFKDHGFNDFEARLLKTYPKREYTVQYRESCLNFVSRLLEDEGIFYFFEHEAKKHTLVLADNPSKVVACPGLGKVTMIGGASATTDADTLEFMHEEEQVTSGKVAYGDFNFLTPTSRLRLEEAGTKYGKLEQYDYPGGYMDPDEGNRYLGLKLEELESSQRIALGSGTSRSFTAGHKFALTDHPRKEMNTDWTLLRVSHHGSNGDYRSASGSAEDSYSNSFVAMPHSVRYLPPDVTPRPRVHGTQTATVVGKSGEEIWTDKYGRVKVQFHWDRDGKQNESSSLWVRVSTPWSGKNWGMIAIPRMGQEVVVDFLEGDPDRPIIVGMVYNADYMPPWELPANQTQSGILTRSTKGGAAANANELRFEDKKGSEEIFIHAEKQLTTEVEADEFRTVGANRTTTIQKDDKRINKEGDEVTLVEKGNIATKVKQKWVLEVEDDNMEAVVRKGDYSLAVESGAHTTTVQKDMTVEVNEGAFNTTVTQGDVSLEVDQGNLETQVKMGNVDTKVKMGNYTIKLDLGKVTIEAMQSIELKVGQSSVKISQTGVEIKGMQTKVEGTIQTSIKGLMSEVKGDAMLQAKGAITMIG
jgi:type VI secretion system secreted protein VgrG